MDLSLAVQILRSQPYGFLATAGSPAPGLRLVQHLRVDDDATVWIGTSPHSRKVHEVGQAAGVSYAVEDRARFGYAAVRGRAEVVTDLGLRQSMWDPGLAAFFPAGPAGDDFVLLRVAASTVELMSFADGVHPDPYGLSVAVVRPA